MYVENAQGVKESICKQLDVYMKMVTGVAMKNKTKEECKAAILAMKTDNDIKERVMKNLIFDREPCLLPLENHLKFIFKAAGQTVGLEEVNIRIIR
jgi:hypothetical protein